MEVTNRMVDLYMAFYGMEEGRESANATLLALSEGNNTLPSKLVDLEVSLNGENSVMKPLWESYWAAKGVTEPTLSMTVANASNEEKERLVNALEASEPKEATNVDKTAEKETLAGAQEGEAKTEEKLQEGEAAAT